MKKKGEKITGTFLDKEVPAVITEALHCNITKALLRSQMAKGILDEKAYLRLLENVESAVAKTRPVYYNETVLK